MQAACIARFGLAGLLASLVTGSTLSAAEVKLPGGTTLEAVDFERHVVGLFGRAGCNLGSCHGSFQGRGGFRLTLFGFDAAKDYEAVSRDALGRRIDLVDPDSSLLLLKATGAVAHGGGKRFDKGSWTYNLLREWIAQGAQWNAGSGEVKSITVTPGEYAFTRSKQTGRLRVFANFPGGTREEITDLCDFRTNDDAIVEVDRTGKLKALQAGDTAVIVTYRSQVVPVRVMVPGTLPRGVKYPEVAVDNPFDREVFAKLKRLNIIPSDLSTDEQFLRRVTLDTIGTLPSPDEVREFLADRRSDKRARKIDELLAHPLHAALWATKLSDITGNNTDALENPPQNKARLSQMWHEWLRKRVADNVPYDEIVKGVLTATSRNRESVEEFIKRVEEIEAAVKENNYGPYAIQPGLDLFWRRQQQNVPPDQWGQKAAAAFLGIRLECAECHKHPFDRWTQVDYRAFANLFTRVAVGASPETAKVLREYNQERVKKADAKNRNQVIQVRELYVGNLPVDRRGRQPRPTGLLRHPDTNEPLPPKALGGPELPIGANQDPRAALHEWLRDPKNPYFARSFVNRVWGHYFGVGIVHPVDDFSLANPPSNPRLLDALAQAFIDSKYDIRHLERLVLNTRAYQLSSVTNDTNKLDKNNYSRAYVRPLMAEVVIDMINSALGVEERFGAEVPSGARAIEVGASRLQNAQLAYAFRIFGKPPRTTACDCERGMEPGLVQKLYLLADPAVQSKVSAPRGRLRTLLARQPDDRAALDELFLATVTRLPNETEREAFAIHRESQPNREAAFADVLWALVNTTEFILNH